MLNNETVSINLAVHGERHSKTAGNLANLGWMKLEQDRPNEALPLLGQALSIQQTVFSGHHPQLACTPHHPRPGGLDDGRYRGGRDLAEPFSRDAAIPVRG